MTDIANKTHVQSYANKTHVQSYTQHDVPQGPSLRLRFAVGFAVGLALALAAAPGVLAASHADELGQYENES